MKPKINPEHEKAEYGMSYIFHDKKPAPPNFHPMRFGKKHINKILTAYWKGDWPTIRRLSIPPFVTKTKPQTPNPA